MPVALMARRTRGAVSTPSCWLARARMASGPPDSLRMPASRWFRVSSRTRRRHPVINDCGKRPCQCRTSGRCSSSVIEGSCWRRLCLSSAAMAQALRARLSRPGATRASITERLWRVNRSQGIGGGAFAIVSQRQGTPGTPPRQRRVRASNPARRGRAHSAKCAPQRSSPRRALAEDAARSPASGESEASAFRPGGPRLQLPDHWHPLRGAGLRTDVSGGRRPAATAGYLLERVRR